MTNLKNEFNDVVANPGQALTDAADAILRIVDGIRQVRIVIGACMGHPDLDEDRRSGIGIAFDLVGSTVGDLIDVQTLIRAEDDPKCKQEILPGEDGYHGQDNDPIPFRVQGYEVPKA
jgi:hypothetical protein